MMERMHASFSISMTELKKNPTRVKRDAGLQPIVVLNHNKPAFYACSETMLRVAVERLAGKSTLQATSS
jgi:antitoxin StbD